MRNLTLFTWTVNWREIELFDNCNLSWTLLATISSQIREEIPEKPQNSPVPRQHYWRGFTRLKHGSCVPLLQVIFAPSWSLIKTTIRIFVNHSSIIYKLEESLSWPACNLARERKDPFSPNFRWRWTFFRRANEGIPFILSGGVSVSVCAVRVREGT